MMKKLTVDKLKYPLSGNGRYTTYIILTLVIFLIGGIVWISGNQQISGNSVEAAVEPWYRGSDNASVTIDVYPDFTCSACLERERFAVQAFNDGQGEIRLIYHHYQDSGVSELIAEALEAAGDQGKFWELHDRLIDDSAGDIYDVISAAESFGLSAEEYAVSRIMEEAELLGLDVTRLSDDLQTGHFTQKVRGAKQDAVLAGVESPSVFINGREFTKYPATYDDFLSMVGEGFPVHEVTGTN